MPSVYGQCIKSYYFCIMIENKSRTPLSNLGEFKLIEQLTGRIDTEEVLGIIFKSFCIGK